MQKGYFPDAIFFALFERQTKSIFIGMIFRKIVGSRQKQILKQNIIFLTFHSKQSKDLQT